MAMTNYDRIEGRHEPSWRVVVDALPDPAIMIDATGVILHHNPQLADLYPRARPGLSISAIIRIPELLQAIDQARDAEQPMVVQLHDRVPVTRRLSAIISAIATDEPRAGTPAILITFRDMTDQEKHAKMRADFIANASHELRTPLASLKVIVETLQGPASNDTAARERFLAMMTTQTSRMTRLIDDLLSLQRAEMKAHLPPRDRVDICELLDWVNQSLEPLAHANGAELTLVRPEPVEVWVRGEREELAQVFLNLVQNGIKYGGNPGKIDISINVLPEAAGRPTRVAISVADNGEGIPSEHIPRLTERFYRVNVVASREKGGTGLGLAIVKYIVSRHRGELSIDSTIGAGSIFTVTLPVVSWAQKDHAAGN
jgi:two-component system, OmpR family, phosphate regulon sensor histidine kinase PhoR